MSDPDPKYDQEFFLNLARPRDDTDDAREEARKRWNAWQNNPANKDISVNFRETNFCLIDNIEISFRGFIFGSNANFAGAIFPEGADFSQSVFYHGVDFSHSAFEGGSSFRYAHFSSKPNFSHAKFIGNASFSEAEFGLNALFYKCDFFGAASFHNAIFSDRAYFADTIFHKEVSFFGEDLSYWLAHSLERRFGYMRHSMPIEIEKMEKEFLLSHKLNPYGPHRFQKIDFSRARFKRAAVFSGRSFEARADFSRAVFLEPPDFDGCSNMHRVDLTGARVGFGGPRPWWKPAWTTDSSVPVRLRAFRAIAEQTKNHDLERDLYIEERNAERGVYFAQTDLWQREAIAGRNRADHVRTAGRLAAHMLWIGVMFGYWLFSNYGRSWFLPSLWLGGSVLLFGRAFDVALASKRKDAEKKAFFAAQAKGEDAVAAAAATHAAYKQATHQIALSNAAPFVGPLTIDSDLKKFLMCGEPPATASVGGKPCVPVPPTGYQAAMIGQNVLSLILVFFIGLALRNYFKVK